VGFPVTVTNGGMKTIVLDKDTTGKLWVSYTQQTGSTSIARWAEI
jgi:hypothetical protein